jgi:asparagine synthase (glutamine-hydrolysing)
MEIERFQLPHLLRYADRNSMRHSIEARLPFLDHQLVESALGVDNRSKIRNGWTKHVLRVALAGLVPDDILWRKVKLGFEAPDAAWLDAVGAEMRSAIGRSAIVKRMCKDKPDFDKIDRGTLWRLYSIAKWEDIYAVQLTAGADASPESSGYSQLNRTPHPMRMH